MSVLITGGAGYIGRHTARLFRAEGRSVVLLDNLSTGRRESQFAGTFVEGDIRDTSLVRHVLREHAVSAVVHLAASAHVGDSMARPDLYYGNNVCGTASLLDAMAREGVNKLVFASSCSVYGNAASHAASEAETVAPVSPYGESKLTGERALPWYAQAFGLQWIALRYFNVAGAEDDLGEDLAGCRRIIPRTVHAAAGEGSALQVFGTSFETPDGSAVRDYVHVADVARANLQALRFVRAGHAASIVNIAAGVGVSVRQIIAEVERQTGDVVPRCEQTAREGDPGCAIADISRARRLLDWQPERSALPNIVASVLASARLRARVLQQPVSSAL